MAFVLITKIYYNNYYFKNIISYKIIKIYYNIFIKERN